MKIYNFNKKLAIKPYFSDYPELLDFQNELTSIIQNATINNYNDLAQEIINLEDSYIQILGPSEDSLIYMVGSVARHSHKYWATSGVTGML